jgi:hypothetical protein
VKKLFLLFFLGIGIVLFFYEKEEKTTKIFTQYINTRNSEVLQKNSVVFFDDVIKVVEYEKKDNILIPLTSLEKNAQEFSQFQKKEISQEKPNIIISRVSSENIDTSFDVFFSFFGEGVFLSQQGGFLCSENSEFVFSVQYTEDSGVFAYFPAFTLPLGKCRTFLFYKNEKIWGPSIILYSTASKNDIVKIKNISPQTITKQSGDIMMITGQGLDTVVGVQLHSGQLIDVSFVQNVSPTLLVISLPENIPPGEYFFRFLAKDKIYDFPFFSFNIDIL